MPQFHTLQNYLPNLKKTKAIFRHLKNNKDWHPKSFKSYALLMLSQTFAAAGVWRVFKPGFKSLVGTNQNQYGRYFYDPRDFNKIAQTIIKKNNLGQQWINKYFQDFKKATKIFQHKVNDFYHSYQPSDLVDLKKYYTDIMNSALRAQSYGYLTEAFAATGSSYWVTDYIKKLAPNISEADISTLLQPISPSFINDFEFKLSKARKKSDFQKILKDYYWVQGSYINLPQLNIKKLKKLKTHYQSKTFKQIKFKKRTILKNSSSRLELTRFIKIIEILIELQDIRKANVMQLNYAQLKTVQLIHKSQSKWPVNDLLNCTPHEILAIMDGKLKPSYLSIIKKRNKKNVWIFAQRNYWVTSDKKTVQKFFKLLRDKKTNLIKGQIASPGTAQGRAKIVMSEQDFHKLNKGDILITSMTRPEFLPVLKKAAAFVTNEGGVTCHAAIVSREMGKPCIIGTKNATHNLKDGDLIKVDAYQGIVRKLNK